MDVKRWLNRARNIDREIDHLIEQRSKEYERLLSITPNYSGDVITGTKDPHRYDRLTEYDMEINREIDRLADIKTEISKAISQLEDGRYREILRLRYLGGKTFEQIAVETHFSWRHVCTLHGRALIALREVLDG